MPYPPRKWTEKWAYDHPRQALALLIVWLGLVGATVWLLFFDR